MGERGIRNGQFWRNIIYDLEGYNLQGTALEPKMRQCPRSFSGYQLMVKDPEVDQQQLMQTFSQKTPDSKLKNW